MGKQFTICVTLIMGFVLLTSCNSEKNITQQQTEEISIIDVQHTPSAAQDVEIIDINTLWSMDLGELTVMRDSLYGGRTLSEMLPNERHNAVLIDYWIRMTTSTQQNAVLSNYAEYPLYQEVEIDLNSDGDLEKIVVAPTDSGVLLKINDLQAEYSNFYNLSDTFAVVDIDTKDKYKEIVISDMGLSSDEYSVFYYYDGDKIIFMNDGANDNRPMPDSMLEYRNDEIGGLFNVITYKGDGVITARQRASILQTWFYPITYKLTENHRLRVEPELFTVDYMVFVLMGMPLHTERSENSSTITMEKDTIVRFTAMDDVEWIQVTLEDGQTGWFRVKNFNKIILGTSEIFATDVFFYLSYSD